MYCRALEASWNAACLPSACSNNCILCPKALLVLPKTSTNTFASFVKSPNASPVFLVAWTSTSTCLPNWVPTIERPNPNPPPKNPPAIPPIPPSESSVAVLATVALVAVADVVTAAPFSPFSPTVTFSC